MANYFCMGLVGPLRPINVKRNSFNQTSKKTKKVNLSVLSLPVPLSTLPTPPLVYFLSCNLVSIALTTFIRYLCIYIYIYICLCIVFVCFFTLVD